ncbi:hypothetical protein PTSG_00787 [Salpingoeca rosetta]|uniref:BZIP domain-containing protein n=1 Tax=Salpingoeca rosetta (strain ATCC 50818 / BSB-021) TaxID=946362 RepID=F2TXH1_SALR5|nr:uncharacterized protein PTSG_00787 [Salpingoeca rosetta]EGD76080.1 hypothetical protein PTSG_00787 [Salpingoeca rosetta]|eukprot:XP_004998255.1 hypothetical protein PTSG_00787 [Salpingoeca rosetta]
MERRHAALSPRKRLLRRPTTSSSRPQQAQQQVQHLTETVKRLQEENATLKQRLTDLRRATRASTIVKKAPTQHALPRIRSARKTEDTDLKQQVQNLREANATLRQQLTSLKEEQAIAAAEARATINAQNTRAHEMSADINRLTHTVREAQDTLKKEQDEKQALAAEVKQLQQELDEAKRETAACAAIARAQHQRHVSPTEQDSRVRRLEHDMAILQADNDRLTEQCLELQRDAASTADLRKQVHTLKAKLASAEAEAARSSGSGDAAAQAEWKRMYQEWMKKAETKIRELQAANQLIQKVCTRENVYV